ncbi:MAG: DsbE family thiol:disulfide interchange protein [Rhizobiales bacterium]|nr:DsbE family thiol:disulfide interchange protein [Hyphomicrobiales bacterium]
MSEAPPLQRNLWPVLLPVIFFAALAALLWRGLSGNPSDIPSALIGKPVPDVSLPAIEGMDVPAFDTASLKAGSITVVNVWGSWCGPCRVEHPLLLELAKRSDIRLFGINYQDEPGNARRFLGTLGQPFAAIVVDRAGRAALDWGVYGVPETFIVDGAGLIRYKWIGPLTPEGLKGRFAQEIEKAKTPLN